MNLWNNVARQCFMTTCTFIVWWCILNNLRRVGSRGRIREFKRVRPYDRGISKCKFEIQDNPKFNKRFSTNSLLMSQRIVRTWCLLLGHKERKVVVYQQRSHNVLHMARCIWVNVYLKWIIVLVVERMGIWLGIVPWTWSNKGRVIKHKQVVLLPMLLRKFFSMLSCLRVIKKVLVMLYVASIFN